MGISDIPAHQAATIFLFVLLPTDRLGRWLGVLHLAGKRLIKHFIEPRTIDCLDSEPRGGEGWGFLVPVVPDYIPAEEGRYNSLVAVGHYNSLVAVGGTYLASKVGKLSDTAGRCAVMSGLLRACGAEVIGKFHMGLEICVRLWRVLRLLASVVLICHCEGWVRCPGG